MRMIQTRAVVGVDRKLTIEVPPDVAPGEHHVVVVIGDLPGAALTSAQEHDEASEASAAAGTGSLLADLGIVALSWRA